jgi:enamine deaminase RidA (YjgF/YER057c/UK114 family)
MSTTREPPKGGSLHRILQPPGWPRPRGYANGVAARGELLFVSGQIGWNERGEFPRLDLAGQVEQTLRNTLAVLAQAGGRAEHIVRQTWYITSREEYLAATSEVGLAWRTLMGKNFPAMAVVQVSALIEPQAKVEIETTAVIPEE